MGVEAKASVPLTLHRSLLPLSERGPEGEALAVLKPQEPSVPAKLPARLGALRCRGVPLDPLLYEFLGGMVPCGPWFRVGGGAWLRSPAVGAFPEPYIVLCCILRVLPEDVSAIEREMEQLAKELRKGMTLGFSQADVGFALGALFGVLSQTTMCCFEAQQLCPNMWKLQPLLRMWPKEVDQNRLGLGKIETILPQVGKRNQTSRERQIGNNLEKLFLQCLKPAPQQISLFAGQLLQKELVRV
ncbi:LOW QUALITY PROTEIN: POU domain, class 5, transcription factor 2 [Dugong dugon]